MFSPHFFRLCRAIFSPLVTSQSFYITFHCLMLSTFLLSTFILFLSILSFFHSDLPFSRSYQISAAHRFFFTLTLLHFLPLLICARLFYFLFLLTFSLCYTFLHSVFFSLPPRLYTSQTKLNYSQQGILQNLLPN